MAVAVITFFENLTTDSILFFIGNLAASETVGWFTEKALEKCLGPSDNTGKIIKALDMESKKTRYILKNTAFDQKWEHMNDSLIKADEEITYMFDILNTYASSDANERANMKESYWKSFRKGILDIKIGIYYRLKIINNQLIGRSEYDDKPVGLLKLWSDMVYKEMLENPISAKTYRDKLMKYMHKVAVLQSQGSVLIKGASDNCDFCREQILCIKENIEKQKQLLMETIPQVIKYLENPKQKLFILSIGTKVIYGPPVGGTESHHELRLRKRNLFNEDEEWIFEQSPSYDEDGSLLISENSKKLVGHKGGYIRLYNDIPHCDANQKEASSFYVMPLHPISEEFEVCICASEKGNQGFLQSDTLQISGGRKNIRFALTPFQHP